jgi:Tfp pilus assembly protein PilE
MIINMNRIKRRRLLGFTLIEVILYVSLVTVLMSALIPFSWSVIGSSAKSSSQQDLFSQARFISERIKYEIRNANSINSVTATSIDLNTATNSSTVIAYDSTNKKVTITYGLTGTPVTLNANNTRVTGLTFTDNTSFGFETQNIQFSLTLDDALTSVRQEYSVPPVSIEGSAEVRTPAQNPALFTPIADTFVVSLQPNDTSGGVNTMIGVDSGDVTSGEISAYFRFDLTRLAGRTITNAKLQLTADGDGTIGLINIKQVSNITWLESTTNYNNRPAMGTLITTFNSFPPSTTQQFDVTSYVAGKAGQLVSIGLDTAQTDAIWVHSKENATNPPALIVTYTATTPTPTPVPTATPIPPTATPVPPTATPVPPAWPFRKKITIQESQITGTSSLSNFPVLISLPSDAQLASTSPTTPGAQADGDDIKFTSSDGVSQLDHEIETFDKSTGKLVAWVRIPVLSATVDTVIYMYYGNITTGSMQDPINTWDSTFIGVWHLKESPSGVSGEIKDSAATNHGTGNGSMSAVNQVTGKIGGSLNFNGTSNYVNIPNNASLNFTAGQNFTLSAWVKSSQVANSVDDPQIIDKVSPEDTPRYGYELSLHGDLNSPKWYPQVWTNEVSVSAYGTTNVANGSWHYLTAERAGTLLISYEDGMQSSVSTSGSNTLVNTVPLRFGKSSYIASSFQYFYQGQIDEVRIANMARSADWISAEYANQTSPGTFSILGGPETL